MHQRVLVSFVMCMITIMLQSVVEIVVISMVSFWNGIVGLVMGHNWLRVVVI